jgi:hypothetical protein
MFSVSRFLGGLAVVGLSAFGAMPTAQAAGSVGYTDNLCTSFFVDQATNTLKCAKMACAVTPAPAYSVTTNTQVTLTASCQNPIAATYLWTVSPRSDPGCTVPAAQATTFGIQVISSTPRTCYYEVIMTDGAQPTPNMGWVRYGVVWN